MWQVDSLWFFWQKKPNSRRKGLNLGPNHHVDGVSMARSRMAQGAMDRLGGYEQEVWLKISRKKPFGWRVHSVNLKNLRKLAFSDLERPTWYLMNINTVSDSKSVFDPVMRTDYYLVLRAYRRATQVTRDFNGNYSPI